MLWILILWNPFAQKKQSDDDKLKRIHFKSDYSLNDCTPVYILFLYRVIYDGKEESQKWLGFSTSAAQKRNVRD